MPLRMIGLRMAGLYSTKTRIPNKTMVCGSYRFSESENHIPFSKRPFGRETAGSHLTCDGLLMSLMNRKNLRFMLSPFPVATKDGEFQSPAAHIRDGVMAGNNCFTCRKTMK